MITTERFYVFRLNITLCILPVKAFLSWIFINIIICAHFKGEISFMVGSDFNCRFDCLSGSVRSNYGPGCKLSARSFMLPWTIMPPITTNTAFSIVLLPLDLSSSTETLIIIVIVGCVESISPSGGP